MFKRQALDVGFTLKLLLLLVFAFYVVDACKQAINLFAIQVCKMPVDAIWTWVVLAAVGTIAVMVLLARYGIELHDVFGVPELIETAMTGHPPDE